MKKKIAIISVIVLALISITAIVLITISLKPKQKDNTPNISDEEMLKRNPKDQAILYVAVNKGYTTDKYLIEVTEENGVYKVDVKNKKTKELIESIEVSALELQNFDPKAPKTDENSNGNGEKGRMIEKTQSASSSYTKQ